MDTTASGRQTVHIAPSTCPIATCLRCLVCGQREGCSCQPRPWNGKKGDLSNWAFKQQRRARCPTSEFWNPPLLNWLQSRIHPQYDLVDIQEITMCGSCQAKWYKSADYIGRHFSQDADLPGDELQQRAHDGLPGDERRRSSQQRVAASFYSDCSIYNAIE